MTQKIFTVVIDSRLVNARNDGQYNCEIHLLEKSQITVIFNIAIVLHHPLANFVLYLAQFDERTRFERGVRITFDALTHSTFGRCQ